MESQLCMHLSSLRRYTSFLQDKCFNSIFTVHGFIPLSSFSSISEQLLAWLLIKDWYQHKAPHVINRENEIHKLSKCTKKKTNLLFSVLVLAPDGSLTPSPPSPFGATNTCKLKVNGAIYKRTHQLTINFVNGKVEANRQ